MSDARLSLKDRMRLGADIVRDAGGRIIGRTRLQKSVFLLSLAGFEKRFQFGYKHYGPFSESLAEAVDLAVAFDLISERRDTGVPPSHMRRSLREEGWASPSPIGRST